MDLKVYLVGGPHFDVKEFLRFLDDRETGWQRSMEVTEAEEIVEASGRVCYMSFGDKQSPRSTSEYIRHLVFMGHESVLEHINWSFVIAGASRALSHQLVRHRVGFAFSQLSQQYHDESYAPFLMPSQVKQNPRAADVWERAVVAAREAYREILKLLEEQQSSSRGETGRREILRAIRSAARSVLPNATETVIFMTANARALRHLFTVRGNILGDEEMRVLAAELLQHVQREAPSVFFDFVVEELPDGSPRVCKVAATVE